MASAGMQQTDGSSGHLSHRVLMASTTTLFSASQDLLDQFSASQDPLGLLGPHSSFSALLAGSQSDYCGLLGSQQHNGAGLGSAAMGTGGGAGHSEHLMAPVARLRAGSATSSTLTDDFGPGFSDSDAENPRNLFNPAAFRCSQHAARGSASAVQPAPGLPNGMQQLHSVTNHSIYPPLDPVKLAAFKQQQQQGTLPKLLVQQREGVLTILQHQAPLQLQPPQQHDPPQEQVDPLQGLDDEDEPAFAPEPDIAPQGDSPANLEELEVRGFRFGLPACS